MVLHCLQIAPRFGQRRRRGGRLLNTSMSNYQMTITNRAASAGKRARVPLMTCNSTKATWSDSFQIKFSLIFFVENILSLFLLGCLGLRESLYLVDAVLSEINLGQMKLQIMLRWAFNFLISGTVCKYFVRVFCETVSLRNRIYTNVVNKLLKRFHFLFLKVKRFQFDSNDPYTIKIIIFKNKKKWK